MTGRRHSDNGEDQPVDPPPPPEPQEPEYPTVRPSRPTFDSGWFLMTILVAIIVGGSVFFLAARLTKAGANTKAIKKNCEERNNAVAAVNDKFAQLNFIFDTTIQNRPPGQPPIADNVLRLYLEFKKPIPLVPCEALAVGSDHG